MVFLLLLYEFVCADSPGPVIRLNPDELHFNDPDYYDEIFNVTNGRADKSASTANAFGPYPAVCVYPHF